MALGKGGLGSIPDPIKSDSFLLVVNGSPPLRRFFEVTNCNAYSLCRENILATRFTLRRNSSSIIEIFIIEDCIDDNGHPVSGEPFRNPDDCSTFFQVNTLYAYDRDTISQAQLFCN